ncbi:MSMEG_6728 family protein [Amnibacterium kyonggiense]
MQTFLPYPSFEASAHVLDGPRLGKQRVETLQILRALVVPTYGWQRHPAVAMWRGRVPALTAYGLAMVREWRSRGFADAVAEQLIEFAPEVEGRSQSWLAQQGLLPSWVGDPLLHESHRSKLVAKDPDVYRSLFPGTPEGLDYVWPGSDVEPEPSGEGHGVWVLRVDALEPWRTYELLGLPAVDARGKATPAWRQQLRAFEDELVPGVVVGVLSAEEPELLHLAVVTGAAAPATVHGVEYTAVGVRFEGNLERRSLPVPAVLQNPRRFFRVRLVTPLEALVGDPETAG